MDLESIHSAESSNGTAYALAHSDDDLFAQPHRARAHGSGTSTTKPTNSLLISKALSTEEQDSGTEMKRGDKPGLPDTESLISDEEYDRLRGLQSRMAAEMVIDNLSAQGILQLRMIRWMINRAEAVRVGSALDKLEVIASLHEKLANEVSRMVEAVKR